MRVRDLAFALTGLALAACASPAIAQDDPFGPIQELIGQIIDGPIAPGAQQPEEIVAEEVAPGEFQGGITLPEDPALRRRLAQAVRLAANGRPEDAAQALGRLAESVGDSDRFIRVDAQSLRSLKAEVHRLIGESPPDVREAYELAFGPAARRMLDEAPADPAMVRRVATLYPHTAAGADALYRLAKTCGDEGAFAEAAACLDRLLAIHPEAAARFEPTLSLRLAAYRFASGDRAGAEAALANLPQPSPDELVRLTRADGSPVGEFAVATLLAQMTAESFTGRERFTFHPADADAPQPPTSDPFLIPRWSAASGEADAVERGRLLGLAAPAVFPTVVGDLILTPTEQGFVAYDAATGVRLWSYPSHETASPSADKTWTGLAKGRLSTDGRAVFLVETEGGAEPPSSPQAGAAMQMAQQQWAFFAVQGPVAFPNAAPGIEASAATTPTPGTNYLTALDVTPPRQGNRLWRVGGESGCNEPALARHAFLGPPLTAHGRLYVIAEHERTVRLAVLEATTGRLEWSLDLGQAEVPLSLDPQRRRIGAVPTLTRGTLLCPTGGGSVVAVDLAGRSLLWGFRYPRSSPPVVADWDAGASASPDVPGWLDATIRVAAGRALLTPPEAGDAYCLDLQTGQPLWQRPRGEDLFIATADADHVLLVGRAGTTLVNAADGTTIGSPMPFPNGTLPSGRGYDADGSYVQPLSDGSLLRVELATGSAAVAASPSRALTLGNLIWHGGMMLSLGPDFLRAFDARQQLETDLAATLAASPDDPVALLRRADLHADARRYAEAIADCRRAYSADPSPAARNRLIAALLDGVRNQLPEAVDYEAELDRLATLR